jgi:hypothetical protein
METQRNTENTHWKLLSKRVVECTQQSRISEMEIIEYLKLFRPLNLMSYPWLLTEDFHKTLNQILYTQGDLFRWYILSHTPY